MLIASLIELFSLGTIIVIINTFLEMGKSGSSRRFFRKPFKRFLVNLFLLKV